MSVRPNASSCDPVGGSDSLGAPTPEPPPRPAPWYLVVLGLVLLLAGVAMGLVMSAKAR
jgi:hypothetical protein